MDFRYDIQGLRALAVLLVFVFHLSSSWLPGGFVGVDIFFVISGYLVSSIILHKIDNNKFSIIQFYESRIKRIVPAYFFVLLITALVAPFVFASTDIYSFRKALFWSIIFNSNNYFASLDNYFGAASSENPLLHTWTLAVEMQFYLILPLLLLLVKNRKVLNILLLVMVIGLLSYCTYNIFRGNAGSMYFSLPGRMPEFLVGVLATTMNLRNYTWIKRNSLVISSLGFIIIVATAFIFDENLHFPGLTALIPTIGTLMILVSSDNLVNQFLSKRACVFIGEISYSIYLWHWPVMAFIRYNNDHYELNLREIIISIITTIIFSILSYYLVERVFRKSKGLKFYIPFAVLSSATVAMVIITIELGRLNQLEDAEFFSPSFGLDSHAGTFTKVESFGDQNSRDSILLIGDSHALVMKKFVDVIGKRNGIRFTAISNNVYPTIPGIDREFFEEGRHYDQYSGLIPHVEKEINNAKLIIIQFSSDGKKWQSAICNLLSNLQDGQRVLVLSDFPALDKNPVRINKDIVKNKAIPNNYVISKRLIDSRLLRIIQNSKKARYVDISDSKVFEDAPFFNDTLMYYDRGHLNTFGATKYALMEEEKIVDALQWGLSK